MLELEVFSPFGPVVVEDNVDYVTIPGAQGDIGVFPGHIALITIINSGIFSFTKAGVTKRFAVHHGFAHIINDKIIVTVKIAESAESIDLNRAKIAVTKSNKRLDELIATPGYEQSEFERLYSKVQRAQTRASI